MKPVRYEILDYPLKDKIRTYQISTVRLGSIAIVRNIHFFKRAPHLVYEHPELVMTIRDGWDADEYEAVGGGTFPHLNVSSMAFEAINPNLRGFL